MVLSYRTDRRTAGPDQVYVETARWGRWVIAAAALAGGAAAWLMIAAVWSLRIRTDTAVLLISGCVSAAVLSPLLWARLAVDGRRFRVGFGALAGGLAAVLSHFAVPAMGLVVMAILDPPGGAFLAIAAAGARFVVFIGFMTLIFAGWITVPIGAVGGWIVTALCQQRLGRALGAVR